MSAFIFISVVLVIATNVFWGIHLFKVVIVTITTLLKYLHFSSIKYIIYSLLQRRDLRAAALHLLYAGIAKAEENNTR